MAGTNGKEMCIRDRGKAAKAEIYLNRSSAITTLWSLTTSEVTEKGISYRYAMEQALAAKGYALHPVWAVGNTDVITRMLLQNHGVSFLPEYVVREYVADGRLAVLDVDCEPIVMWSQLVYHRNKDVTPQMNQFIELMQKHIGQA